MVMFSELLQYRITNTNGEITKLTDLVISQLDTDHPEVTHLIYRSSQPRTERILPWESVKEIDRIARQIKITDYEQAEEIDTLGSAVRLKHDVLDALILDLQNRRSTRANDLWLEEEDGRLRLAAADTSGSAILRRLVRRQSHNRIDRQSLYDWKYIEFLRGDPQAVQAGARYHGRITRLPPGEIGHLAASVPYLHAAELLSLLPKQLAADTLEVMSPERQLQVFEELEEAFAVQVLAHMAPDRAADIVGHLDIDFAQQYLNHLPKKYAERIVDLLKYPSNTVGGIMTNDIVTVPPQMKIAEARASLRERLKEPDFVYFIYVVEDQPPHKLRGVVSLRQTVEEIMNPYLITLSPFDSPSEAGYRLLNSQLAAMPVIGREGELLGTVTIDAAVSQVAPRSWRAQAPRVFS
jgi:magnesium transporter